jgi:hypothetical protein
VIVGHYGLAAGAKSIDVRAPLWSLMLATQWLDVVFIPTFLLGIETIEILPPGGYGEVVIHADFTHSLIGALVLSAAFGAVAWWRWDRRLGLLLGAVAFSHWVLDLIVHRADMPILPGNAGDLPLLGSGCGGRLSRRSCSKPCCSCLGCFCTGVRRTPSSRDLAVVSGHHLLLGRCWRRASSSWHSTRSVSDGPAYWPTRPSIRSRKRSAWPLWRAYSSIM